MSDFDQLFPESYEASRDRFRENYALIQERWPSAHLESRALSGDEDLTIDWLVADALERREKILIFTNGEHGIEGYVGSGILQLFVENYLQYLDPKRTGLLLMHCINPWGMRNLRRVNAQNVDLNRNFVWGPGRGRADAYFAEKFPNIQYERLSHFLNPQGEINPSPTNYWRFLLGLAGRTLSMGMKKFRGALLLGQYNFPKGIFFGGQGYQEETILMMELLRENIGRYAQTLLLDMHTGYGPRSQMSLVNSCLEKRGSQTFQQTFGYPLVVKANPKEFYSIHGDMVDYVYNFVLNEFPDKKLYATSFEFGTYGDSSLAAIRSLRTLILENQLHWFGTKSEEAKERTCKDFRELYFPESESWKAKAVADAEKAFQGILAAEGYWVPITLPFLTR
ncbi:MAG: M14 family metallopeptidase [Anaerolineales bacterium]|jgi:hypothetical protein